MLLAQTWLLPYRLFCDFEKASSNVASWNFSQFDGYIPLKNGRRGKLGQDRM
jgi:hypothetical protein